MSLLGDLECWLEDGDGVTVDHLEYKLAEYRGKLRSADGANRKEYEEIVSCLVSALEKVARQEGLPKAGSVSLDSYKPDHPAPSTGNGIPARNEEGPVLDYSPLVPSQDELGELSGSEECLSLEELLSHPSVMKGADLA